MKLNKLLTARNVIMGHAQDKVNAKLAYKMMKFVKGTEDEEGFYNERVKELIGEYGVKDESGEYKMNQKGNVEILPEKIDECNARIKQLEETEVENPIIKFTIDELSEFKYSMSEIYALSDLIIEEG